MKNLKHLLMISTASLCINGNANAVVIAQDENGNDIHRFVNRTGFKPSSPEALKIFKDLQTDLFRHHKGYAAETIDFPTVFDNSKNFKIVDQGELGSCTANAGCGAMFMRQVIEYLAANSNVNLDTALANVPYLSRLAVYYNERALEGTTDQDSGATIADLIKTLSQNGAPYESDWPYNVSQFTVKPPASLDAEAALNKDTDTNIPFMMIEPSAPDLINQFKTAIYHGYGVTMGITLHKSFESDDVASTGIVPMPTEDDEVIGGHAVTVVGWDDSKQLFKVANSWSTSWGDNGFFYLPYEYLTYGQNTSSESLNDNTSLGSNSEKNIHIGKKKKKHHDPVATQPYLNEAWVIGNVSLPQVKSSSPQVTSSSPQVR